MADRQKDSYLESLYSILELCNLTIQYRDKFDPAVVARAEVIKNETVERIHLRELIPFDERS